MILKNKTISRSYGFHSINNIISFCNQVISKYTLYKTKRIGFPFLYLLKIEHKPFLHYYIFKNIINLSLKMQVYNIESKHQMGIHNAQAIYRRLPVLPLAHSGTNLIVNKMQKDISIKKFSLNTVLNILASKAEKTLNFLEKKPSPTKTLGLSSKTNKTLKASNKINKEILNTSDENVHYLSRMSLKGPGFIEKDIPKIQQNIFLHKKTKHIKSKDELSEIKFLSIHNVQAVPKYNRLSIATLPIFSNTDLSINKILSNQLQANILTIKESPANAFLRSDTSIPYLSRISHKTTHIKSELMDNFRQIKTEFIFLNPNKQLDEIRHTIQKQINREQPKEEVVSVRLNKDRNALKSRDFQNIVDQVYKLILKRWQKDLERRGIFYA